RSWNAHEKLAIVTYLERNPTATKQNTAERQLNIGGRPKYPLLEDDLKTWVKSLCSRQKIISRYMVKTKANQLAKQSHFLSLYPTINECKLPEDLEPKRDEFL
ncbi:20064_t:CDS:2, partial [Dentiscutata erythropus]